uniref:solute carrier family 13 member 5-like n=1 Tax=Styela clava TaxID=7725 RepID=UPI00193A077A|nr:solute carrier family 13 member 5-like [Styela clava]
MSLSYFFSSLWRFRKSAILLLTPILLLPMLILGNSKVSSCGYVICIMSVYWTTEACPLVVTSLIPLLLFPLFGIQTADEVSMSYTRHTCFLFLGTFILCIAIEEWNLHRRFSLRVLLLFGSKPCWIMLGMMFITGFLSMWLSNTSTCALMHPITVAICREISTAEKNRQEPHKNKKNKDVSDNVLEVSDNTEDMYNNPEVTQFISKNNNDDILKVQEDNELEEESSTKIDGKSTNLEKSMLLAVTYASTLGGICTIVGTPTNLVAIGIFIATFGEESGQDLNFVSWFIFCLPMTIILIIITWIWVLCRFRSLGQLRSRNTNTTSKRIKKLIQANYDKLAPMSFGEICVVIHFLVLILLWFLRDPKIIPGWRDLFPNGYAKDSTTAVLVGMCVFLFPSQSSSFTWIWKKPKTEGKKEYCLPTTSPALLSWKTFQQKFPWDVMLLLGAGFSLAGACENSGLSEWFGRNLTAGLRGTPVWIVLLVVSISISLLTEFTSNVATTSIFLPIMIGLSRDLSINPVYILLIATLSCSFAFSLPIATPPNALAFTFGSLRVTDMVTTGLPLNFICVGVLNAFIHMTGVSIFHLDVIPAWAMTNGTYVVPPNSTLTPGQN